MTLYIFAVEGCGADGQSWKSDGSVEAHYAGDFMGCIELAIIAAFRQLTAGKAVYGQPGVGCRGPYRIARFTIQQSDA